MRPISSTLLIIIFSVASLIIAAATYVQTHHFKEFLRTTVNSKVSSSIDQRFHIGSIEGSIIYDITLRDVELITEETALVKIEEITAQYYLPSLLSFFINGDIPLRKARVSGAEINITRDESGIWNFRKIKTRKKKQDGEKPINVYLSNASISRSKVIIDDGLKDRYLTFLFYDSRLSIDLIELNKKFVVDAYDLNVDFNKLGNLKFRDIKTNAIITTHGATFEDLKGSVNGMDIRSSGTVNDFSFPEITADVLLDEYSYDGIGTFNANIKTKAKIYSLSNIAAEADVDITNSTIRDNRLQASFKDIRMNGTRIDIKGDINYELGRSGVDGYVDVKQLLTGEKINEYYLNTDLDDLLIKDLFKTIGIRSGLLKVHNDLKADTTFAVKGSWSDKSNFTASFDVSDLNLRVDEQNPLKADGRVQVSADRFTFDLKTRSYKFPVSSLLALSDSSVLLNSDLKVSGDIPYKETKNDLALTVKGSFDNSTMYGISLIRGSIDSIYDGQNLKRLFLNVSSNFFSLEMQGENDEENSINVLFNASSEDIAFLNNLYNKEVKPGGAVKLNGTLTGSMKNPKMNVNADISGLKYGNKFYVKEGKIDLSTEFRKNEVLDFDINSDLHEIEYGNTYLKTLKFMAKTFSQDVKVHLNGQFSDTERMVSDLIVYNFENSNKKIDIHTLDLDLGGQSLSNTETLTISLGPNRTDIHSLLLKNGKSEIYADGYLSYNDKQSDLMIKVKSINLASVSSLLPNDVNIQGYADLEFSLSGHLSKPRVSLISSSDSIMINDQYRFSPSIKITGLENKTRINLRDKNKDGTYSVVSGTVRSPIDFYDLSKLMEAELDLKMKLNGMDISPLLLFEPYIKELYGNLTTDLLVTGSLLAPELNGTSKLENTSILTPLLENSISANNAVIDFKNNRATLLETIVTSSEGKAKVSGDANLDNFTYQADINLDDFYIKYTLFDTKLNGILALKGKNWKIRLTGKLEPNDLEIEIKSQREEQISSDITFVDVPETKHETAEQDGTYYKNNVAADLELNIPDNTWISQQNAKVAVAGDLNISKDFGAFHVISGTISTKKGNYTVFGKLFKIKKGFLNFPSIEEFNPQVDLTADYEIQDRNILINIVGEAQDPTINLSSTPPMSKEDIISYLIFGIPNAKLGSDQRHLSQELASSIAMEELTASILPKLGLDSIIHVVSIQNSKQGNFSQPQVKVGSFINDRLYVSYKRELSVITTSSPNLQNKVNIEYDLTDSFLINSVIGGSNTGVDIFYHFDF